MENNAIAEQEATVAVEKWLTLIELGNFDESWNQTAQLFRAAVPLEQWKSTLESLRLSFGKTLSRAIKSKRYAEELPGAPDGEYVVIEYETTFENKKTSLETVTPMKDADGEWRVSGYFIK